MKYLILLISICYTVLTGISQTDTIHWNKKTKLDSSDFKIKESNSAVQVINGTFILEYNIQGKEAVFSKNYNKYVICYFDKQSSWMSKGNNTYELIKFTQGRFDLTEIAARKLRKSFAENKKQVIKGRTKQYYDQVLDELEEMESEYISETNNGKDPGAMKLWQKKIKRLLAELNDYSQYSL